MSDLPNDPLSPLASAAIATHEMMAEFMKAGFSEPQAYDLAKSALIASLSKIDPQ